jgi:hypothetical protein
VAAGADIREMSEKTYMEAYQSDMFDAWEGVSRTSKPVIAAVNGEMPLGARCRGRGVEEGGMLTRVGAGRLRARRRLRAGDDV